jgi:hypothetical protein
MEMTLVRKQVKVLSTEYRVLSAECWVLGAECWVLSEFVCGSPYPASAGFEMLLDPRFSAG